MTESSSEVSWELRFVRDRGGRLTWKEGNGTFWSDRNVLYLRFGSNFMVYDSVKMYTYINFFIYKLSLKVVF